MLNLHARRSIVNEDKSSRRAENVTNIVVVNKTESLSILAYARQPLAITFGRLIASPMISVFSDKFTHLLRYDHFHVIQIMLAPSSKRSHIYIGRWLNHWIASIGFVMRAYWVRAPFEWLNKFIKLAKNARHSDIIARNIVMACDSKWQSIKLWAFGVVFDRIQSHYAVRERKQRESPVTQFAELSLATRNVAIFPFFFFFGVFVSYEL